MDPPATSRRGPPEARTERRPGSCTAERGIGYRAETTGQAGIGGSRPSRPNGTGPADAGAQQLVVAVVLGHRGGDVALREMRLDEHPAGALPARGAARGQLGHGHGRVDAGRRR